MGKRRLIAQVHNGLESEGEIHLWHTFVSTALAATGRRE
jgi:hypothetical protein